MHKNSLHTPLMDDSCVGSVHFENGSKAGDAVSSRFEGGPMAAEQKTRTSLAAETLPLSNSSEEEELEGNSDEGFVLPIAHPPFEPAVALAANNYLKGQEKQLKMFWARIVDLEKVLFHTRHVLQEREQTVEKDKDFARVNIYNGGCCPLHALCLGYAEVVT